MHQDVDIDSERIEVECADRVVACLRPKLWRQSVEVMPVEVWLQIDELLTGSRKDGSQELIGIDGPNEVSHVFAVDSQSDHTRCQPPPGNDCRGNRQKRMRRLAVYAEPASVIVGIETEDLDRFQVTTPASVVDRYIRRNLVGILRSGFDRSQPDPSHRSSRFAR